MNKRRKIFRHWSTFFLLMMALLAVAGVVRAQETGPIGQLFITGSNVDSYPNVNLRVYGYDGQGNPIDFATQPVNVTHNGVPVSASFAGTEPVGTLTVFLVDAPAGIAEQIPAIQDAIIQYASPGGMEEQRDHVAIYQIGTDGPQQLLAPNPFYNAVRNQFVTPLAAETGPTALYDSTVALLELVPTLKPQPETAAFVVLISDGTDAVSSQFESGDVPTRAAEAGIPVFTIALTNPNLSPGPQELGHAYLRDLAAGSRGLAASLDDPASLSAIWSRIGAFRNQSLLRYMVSDSSGGTFPVEVTLADNPDLRAATDVTVEAGRPNVVLNVPEESRSLTIPAPNSPVRLQLSAAVSWLDGVERAITAAALRVNGVEVFDIPVESLDNFTAEINNLTFGENPVEVVVVDEQGQQGASAPVVLQVSEGALELPAGLRPGGLGSLWPWILLALLAAGLVVAAAVLITRGRRAEPGSRPSLFPRGRSGRSRRQRESVSYEPLPPQSAGDGYPPGRPGEEVEGKRPILMAHLDVLAAQSFMPQEITLGETVVRLGRSPVQSDVAFREDLTVSRLHATLRLEGNRYRIYDEGSSSGTFVNGQEVPEYGIQLADGDEIYLGAVRLRYRQL
jgi:hypothetical protein